MIQGISHIMGAKERDEMLKKAFFKWVEKEEAHNPGFSFVVGSKSFTPRQMKEHVEKGTQDGEMLLNMAARAGASLFLNNQ